VYKTDIYLLAILFTHTFLNIIKKINNNETYSLSTLSFPPEATLCPSADQSTAKTSSA